MRIMQEDTVRQLHLKQGLTEIHVADGTYITQQARDYIKEKQLTLVLDGTAVENGDIRPAPEITAGSYCTPDGRRLNDKPEQMTHLHGNVLVAKNHPCIVLRGQLDLLEAEIICLQVQTAAAGAAKLTADLGELLGFCRRLLSCEVTGKPLAESKLLGLDQAQLRDWSQHPQQYLGVGHLLPAYSHGAIAVGLNRLRALTRTVELAAVNAFCRPDGTVERPDLVQGLNRLSSAFYILQLRRTSESRESESHE